METGRKPVNEGASADAEIRKEKKKEKLLMTTRKAAFRKKKKKIPLIDPVSEIFPGVFYCNLTNSQVCVGPSSDFTSWMETDQHVLINKELCTVPIKKSIAVAFA